MKSNLLKILVFKFNLGYTCLGWIEEHHLSCLVKELSLLQSQLKNNIFYGTDIT